MSARTKEQYEKLNRVFDEYERFKTEVDQLRAENEVLRSQLQAMQECTGRMEVAAEDYAERKRFKWLSDDPFTWAGLWNAMLTAREEGR